ncbi:MAG: hypothetical protein WAK71_25720 [Streptosporangiaceae bacterium]
MHREGSRSWRFGHGDMGYLHTALFIRDAVRLPVASSADVPPRLARDVPDYASLLPPGQRAAAAQQWVIWWRRLVRQAAREARRSVTPLPAGIDPDDVETRNWYRYAGREDVFDPPDFKSLEPPLQSAVTATFKSSLGWSSYEPGGAEPDRFAWRLVRDAAESTAADLGIPVGDVQGYADVLEVEGMWSHLPAPGSALCSAALACDPPAAARLLRELFSSGH